MLKLFWLAALFGPGLAAADEVTLSEPPARGFSWFVLATGRAGTECLTDLFIGAGGETAASLGSLEEDAGCPGRIIVFASGYAPALVANPGFTAGPDRVNVTLIKKQEISLALWSLTCRGERGEPCPPGHADNVVIHDILSDFKHAFYQYRTSFLGLALHPGGELISDVHADPAAESFDASLAQKQGVFNCEDFPTADLKFKPGHLNVYYASVKSGKACGPQPGSADALRQAGFVIMPVGAGSDLLTHELAHILIGTGEHLLEPANILEGNGSFSRCNFDLDQAYRVHELQIFSRYLGSPSLSPRAPKLPGRPAVSDKLCRGPRCQPAARLYQMACPQEVHRRVTDWVRCLHCPLSLPPPVMMAQDDVSDQPMIDILEKALRGHLRVQDRMVIAKEADDAAGLIADRFGPNLKQGGLDREQLVDLHAKRLFDMFRMRAADAFLSLQAPCPGDQSLRLRAVDALERFLKDERAGVTGEIRNKAQSALELQRAFIGPCSSAVR